MRHINDIASWFSKNNLYCEDSEKRITILSLLIILFYRYKNIELEYQDIRFYGDNLSIGIYDYDTDYHFSEEEEFLLNVVNHKFGYLDINYLITLIAVDKACVEETYKKLCHLISFSLLEFESYSFDDFVYIGKNDCVYFVRNTCDLTLEDKEVLDSEIDFENQQIFYVDKEEDGSLIIF